MNLERSLELRTAKADLAFEEKQLKNLMMDKSDLDAKIEARKRKISELQDKIVSITESK